MKMIFEYIIGFFGHKTEKEDSIEIPPTNTIVDSDFTGKKMMFKTKRGNTKMAKIIRNQDGNPIHLIPHRGAPPIRLCKAL